MKETKDNLLSASLTNIRSLRTEYITYFELENEEYENEYLRLIAIKEKGDYDNFNADETQDKINEFAKHFIIEVLKDIETKINKNYGKGIYFSSILNKSREIKKDINVGNKNIADFMNIYEEKVKTEVIVPYEEKEEIGYYRKAIFWRNIVINILIGALFYLLGRYV